MKVPKRCDNSKGWDLPPKFWPQCKDGKPTWMVEIPALKEDLFLCHECVKAIMRDAKQNQYDVKIIRRIYS